MVLIEIPNKGKFGVKEFVFTNFDLNLGGLGMQFLALLRWMDESRSDDVINAIWAESQIHDSLNITDANKLPVVNTWSI